MEVEEERELESRAEGMEESREPAQGGQTISFCFLFGGFWGEGERGAQL